MIILFFRGTTRKAQNMIAIPQVSVDMLLVTINPEDD